MFAEANASADVTVSKTFEVVQGAETSVVIDFDLRKAVVRNPGGTGDSNYKFVTTAEMQTAVRAVIADKCGEVSGDIETASSADVQTYVFIYNKGDFNASIESTGSGASNVMFAKAVTSAKVESDGSYKLSFLEEGDYEVHLAS